jgi:hypothetical protein
MSIEQGPVMAEGGCRSEIMYAMSGARSHQWKNRLCATDISPRKPQFLSAAHACDTGQLNVGSDALPTWCAVGLKHIQDFAMLLKRSLIELERFGTIRQSLEFRGVQDRNFFRRSADYTGNFQRYEVAGNAFPRNASQRKTD